eukprot:TRINITY_DN6175_c0_g1_i1.p1 TRINITY_DN6175_c0_g1~~TRINITY_DN6175_c0_g1_i1.p1  ORF type:complete len:69 (-),score=10.13 TRINITY_DN6175_c0_g1_i1:122-328(-)
MQTDEDSSEMKVKDSKDAEKSKQKLEASVAQFTGFCQTSVKEKLEDTRGHKNLHLAVVLLVISHQDQF